MTNLKIPSALLISGILVGLGLLVWYWPQLPENIATHFDEHGLPNGLLSKPTAVMLSAGLVTLLPLFFVGISVVIRWMPTSTINLPNREYWLAPERRDETLRWMTGWMLWFSAAITIFMVALNHLTFIANRDAQPLKMFWFWLALGGFLLTTFFLIVAMLRRFSSPRIESQNQRSQ